MLRTLPLALILLATSASGADTDPFAGFAVYERDAFSRSPTRCDELAAHPDDPEAVLPGIAQSAVDTDAAIQACSAAVAADLGNPRLNYQLARAYGYAGRHAESAGYRDAALKAGYPQSLFVVGYIRLSGWDGATADPCYGGELIRRSAHAGRYAGLVGFPHYALMGNFDACEDYPKVDAEEMLEMLEKAAAQGGDFYRDALVEQLRARIEAMPGS